MLRYKVFFAILLFKAIRLSKSLSTADDQVTDEPGSPATASSNIRFTANRIVTGLEYLGCGFDAARSNTTGSIDNGEDLGHRAPIVDFYWSKSDVGVTNSLEWLQPVGGWVRPIIACGETQTVEELAMSSNNEDIKHLDIAANASLSGGQGGGINIGYNDATKKKVKKSSKVHKSAYYCFTYAAGMPPYVDWETTEEFKEERDQLPKDLAIFDNCTVKKFQRREKACAEVAKWMDFFSLFGTHVTTEIHLGGRIVRYLTAPTEALETFSKLGFNVDVAVKAIISGALADTKGSLDATEKYAIENLNDACDLRFSVLGGIHVGKTITPLSIRRWKATVPKFPMPIKVTVTPMDQFLGAEYEKVYKEAVNFYVTSNGALPWVVQAHNGFDLNVKSMITAAHQMVITGSGETALNLTCPEESKILFGFILDYDIATHKFNVSICPSVSHTCMREKSDKHRTVIWILCGNSMGLNISQTITALDEGHENKNVKCEKNYSLLTGFVLSTKWNHDKHDENLKPCRTGSGKCKIAGNHEALVWMACVDRRFPGLRTTVTETASSPSGSKKLRIGTKYILLTGLKAYFGDSLQASACEKYALGCTLVNSPKPSGPSLTWGIFHN